MTGFPTKLRLASTKVILSTLHRHRRLGHCVERHGLLLTHSFQSSGVWLVDRWNASCQNDIRFTSNGSRNSFERGSKLFLRDLEFSTISSQSDPSKNDDENSATNKADSSSTKKRPTTESPPSIAPGVALSAVTATTGFQIASVLGSALSVPISGIPASILLGILVNNTILRSRTPQSSTNDDSPLSKYRDPALYKPGLTFSTKTILQTGIVAVAAKLSFFELAKTGAQGLPVVAASMGMGMLYIPFAGRMAGLKNELTYLLTAGTSICGVTAITALAPAINATNRDIAIAVANTVAFGTVGMLAYPYLFHSLCITPEQAGVCLGVSIHDTSQVLGSAMSYKEVYGEEMALKVAAVTKLTRNLGLIGAIPGLTYFHAKQQNASKVDAKDKNQYVEGKANIKDTMSGLVSFQKYVPSFLIAFLGMSTLRTIGDYTLIGDAAVSPSSTYLAFQQTMDFIGNDFSKYALGTAMAGVGLSTSTDSLKGVGWRPFAVGGTGALVVGGTGFLVSSMLM
mmetsp:Transcript_8445/g.17612  ORF Transcript_8445/g.17612 Transcript_8445/m.17612 type:complete len:512 (-) Transcript_8445:178-1713(-)